MAVSEVILGEAVSKAIPEFESKPVATKKINFEIVLYETGKVFWPKEIERKSYHKGDNHLKSEQKAEKWPEKQISGYTRVYCLGYPCLLPRQFQIYFLLFQKLQDEDHAKTTCYRGYPIEANSDIYLQIYFSQIASK